MDKLLAKEQLSSYILSQSAIRSQCRIATYFSIEALLSLKLIYP